MLNYIYIIQNQASVSTASERYLLIYMISVLLIIGTLSIVFFVVFQKRKNKLLLDKIKMQQDFDAAFTKTNQEIQEQTLKFIGQELHDNVGQLLSVANMQLSILQTEVPETIQSRFLESKNAVKESLTEVRELSKSLNREVIEKRGLHESIQNEINRLNRMKLIHAELKITGEFVALNNKDAIILFRILQEFISNTVKYSKAKHLNISLEYSPEKLSIHVQDDGVGFHVNEVQSSSGLVNMKSRAAIIESEYQLLSQPNEGVSLFIEYPILKRALV